MQDELMTLHYGVLPNKNYFLQDGDDDDHDDDDEDDEEEQEMEDDYEDAVVASDEDFC
jgi:hypothetical protein